MKKLLMTLLATFLLLGCSNSDDEPKAEIKESEQKVKADEVVFDTDNFRSYFKDYWLYREIDFEMSFTNNHKKDQEITFYVGNGNPDYHSKKYKVAAGKTVSDKFVLKYMPNGSGETMMRYWVESEYDVYKDSLLVKPLLMIMSLQ